MAVKGHRWQRQQQAAQQEERIEILPPKWTNSTPQELHVELVNTGYTPVYVRDVKLHDPRFEHAISYDTMGPDHSLDPIQSGSRRFYMWSQPTVARFVETLGGTWVTVESNRGEIARRLIDVATLHET